MTSLPTLESVLFVDLARGADHDALIGAGWPALDGGVGCRLGGHENLILPLPPQEGAYFLQIRLAAPLETVLPVRLIVNGHKIAVDTAGHLATRTHFIPPEVMVAEPSLRLELLPAGSAVGDLPAWVCLHSLRVLRVVDRPAGGRPIEAAPEAPALRELLIDFESLGEGPAFTLFRRRHGVRPLDVMQAGHAPLADWLALLDSDFAVLANPGAIRANETAQGPGEATWSVRCNGYGFHYETGVPVAMRRAAAVEAHETARLSIATRRLRQTLAAGTKLLLFQQDVPADDADIIPLLAAVQARGANTILWVTPAEADHPPGSVDVLMKGLMRGYVTVGTGEDVDPGWITVCRRAWRSWRAMAQSDGAAEAA